MAYGSLKQRLSRFLLLFMSLLWISGIVYAYQISPSALQANDLDEEETPQSVLQKYQTELSDVHQSYKRTIASYYEVVQNEYIPQLDSTYNAHYSYMQSMYNNYDGVTQTFSAYSSDMYNECVLGKQELLNIYNDAQSRQVTISANESALQSVQRYQTELSDVYTTYKQEIESLNENAQNIYLPQMLEKYNSWNNQIQSLIDNYYESLTLSDYVNQAANYCSQGKAELKAIRDDAIANNPPEPYAALNDNNTTLTFYYDDQKSSRNGMDVGPFPNADYRGWNGYASNITKVVFDSSMDSYTGLTSTAFWFWEFTNLEEVVDIQYLHTDNVTSMESMFGIWGGTGSTPYTGKLPAVDMTHFNTSKVINMSGVFSNCAALTTLDLSSFDTSSVTDMSTIFSGCTGLRTISVGSGWTTAKVTNSSMMFQDCTSLVGGAGTTYDASHTDVAYAHIDGGESNPGYLTDKNVPASTFNGEVYMVEQNSTIMPNQAITSQNVSMTPGNDTEWTTDGNMGPSTKPQLVLDVSQYYGATGTYSFGYSMKGANTPKDGELTTDESTGEVKNLGTYYRPRIKNLPHSGSYVVFETSQDGSLIIPIRVPATRAIYVTDGSGNAMTDIQIRDDSGNAIALLSEPLCAISITEEFNGFVSFNAKQGEKYYVFVNSTAATRYGGYAFSPEAVTINPATMANVLDLVEDPVITDMEIFHANAALTVEPGRAMTPTQNVSMTTGTDKEWTKRFLVDGETQLNFTASQYYPSSSTTYAFDYSIQGTNGPKDGGLAEDGTNTGSSYDYTKQNLPQSGGFVIYEASKDGSLIIPFSLNANKPIYVVDANGKVMTDIQIKDASGQPMALLADPLCVISTTDASTGFLSFNVKQGEQYYVFGSGTKARFSGYVFKDQTIDIDPATMANVKDVLEGTTAAVAEPYAILSDDQTTLTFFYDDQKSAKNGMDVGLFSIPGDRRWESVAASVTTVKFDESMANCTSLTSTAYWFYGFQTLTTVTGIGNLKTDNVTDMQYMFYDCNLLTNIELTGFNTTNVTNMRGMFYKCQQLQSIDLSSFNTALVTDMSWMFYGCNALTKIIVGSEWTAEGVVTDEDNAMFMNCTKLVGGAGTTYDETHADHTYAHIDGGVDNPGYFTDKDASIELAQDVDGYYLIGTVAEWKAFANLALETPTANGKMTANIDLGDDQTMIGMVNDDEHSYKGHFDGQGHTLDVNYLKDTNVAPFRYVKGATIENLHVTGRIEAYECAVGGIVALINPDAITTIRRCWSSALLVSTTSGHDQNTIGGIVSSAFGPTVIEDCLFDGEFGPDNNIFNAGILTNPFCEGLVIRNTLNVGRYPSNDPAWSGTFFRTDDALFFDVQLDNVYYKNVCGAEQGTQVSDVQLADGSIAALLQKGRSYLVWKQGDATPVLDFNDSYPEVVTNSEPYAVLSENNTVLTFYYDNQKETRGGFSIEDQGGGNTPTPSGDHGTATAPLTVAQAIALIDAESNISEAYVKGKISQIDSYNATYKSITYWISDDGATTTQLQVYSGKGLNGADFTAKEDLTVGQTVVIKGALKMYSSVYEFDKNSSIISIDGAGSRQSGARRNRSSIITDYAETITKVVFDESFANYYPTSTASWFQGCASLAVTSGIENLKTDNVTNMNSMFATCTSLTSLDLRYFKTNNVRNMRSMFSGCSSLTTIYVGSRWSTTNVTESAEMFSGCTNLVGGAGTTYDENHVDKTYARIDGGSSAPGYFTQAETQVAAPTFSWNGEQLAMTTETEDADIYFSVKEYDAEPAGDGSESNPYNVAGVLKYISTLGADVESEQEVYIKGVVSSIQNPFSTTYGNAVFNISDNGDNKNYLTAYRALYLQNQKYTGGQRQIQVGDDVVLFGKVVNYKGSTPETVSGAAYLYSMEEADLQNRYENPITVSGNVVIRAKATKQGLEDSELAMTHTGIEPYAVLSENNTVLNFFYDDKKRANNGMDLCPFKLNYNVYADGYTVSVSGREWEDKVSTITTVVFDPSFANCTTLNSTAGWFCNDSNLVAIRGIEYLNTESITDMSGMFWACKSLTTIDVSSFKTSNVTNMWAMFDDCTSLTTLKYSDQFITSKVTNMQGMFYACSSLTTLDLSGFDVSNVTYFNSMFRGCSKLENLNLTGWNTSSAHSMQYMFRDCSSLKSLDLSGFNTQNVTTMSGMFYDCSGLTSLDVSRFDTQNVTDMQGMFDNCSSLTSLNVSNFNTQNVKFMAGMFYGCSSLTNLDLSHFNTSNVTAMNHMFRGCSKLESLNLSGWNTSKVTTMMAMFSRCESLTNLDVSGFETEAVTDINQMFYNCFKLKSLNLSNFRTPNLKEIHGLFYRCEALESLDISNLNTSQVTDFHSIFYGCASLKSLDISHFDTSQATEMALLFARCSSLASIQAGNAAIPDSIYAQIGNPNLLLYVNEASLAPASLTNVVVDGAAENIVLTDVEQGNNNFYCPQEFTAHRISYTHNYRQATQVGVSRGWETIVLPFTVQTITHEKNGPLAPFGVDGGKPFWLRQLTDNGLISAQRIEANVPYLISMPNNGRYPADYNQAGNVTFSATNVVVPATEQREMSGNNRMLIPTTMRVAQSPSVYAINRNASYENNPEGSIFVADYREVRPFEAYVEHTNGARFFTLSDLAEGDVTDIQAIHDIASADVVKVYNLSGVLLKTGKRQEVMSQLPKGIYIVNGVKVVVK